MKNFIVNKFCEIISERISMKPENQTVVQHADLPEVHDELSVALRLKLKSHASDWTNVFQKGRDWLL